MSLLRGNDARRRARLAEVRRVQQRRDERAAIAAGGEIPVVAHAPEDEPQPATGVDGRFEVGSARGEAPAAPDGAPDAAALEGTHRRPGDWTDDGEERHGRGHSRDRRWAFPRIY